MGTFFHPITLIGSAGQEETVNALVDTGAEFTTIPRPTLERLGIRPHRQVLIRLADGALHTWDLGRIMVRRNGTEEQILCLFGMPDTPPFIGAHTLEAFLLGVDPSGKRLVPREAFLL
jgi:predicted aspartyl protease